ncbi:MAG: SufD family Fe-S cluster assembly protein [Erysipelotrichaceae bacterium]|nr:SufD family Fe-S cluster assembly protein [Erysipelotrichaceae bacterium]
MNEIRLDKNARLKLDSDKGKSFSLKLMAPERGEYKVVLTVEGHQDVKVQIDTCLKDDASLTVLLINHNEGKVSLQENYELNTNSRLQLAEVQLSPFDLELSSVSTLQGQGGELTTRTAILADCRKQISQDVYHKAPNTTAHVNNYGVVRGTGRCEVVVRNTIERGCFRSSTHQTSRILTNDKTAVGKILPILYIDENDVQASHAASLGQPDESLLFYMQTRGLSRNEALKLIIVGYLLPVTEIIDDAELNEMLRKEIEMKVA